jgi:hypothetical protein
VYPWQLELTQSELRERNYVKVKQRWQKWLDYDGEGDAPYLQAIYHQQFTETLGHKSGLNSFYKCGRTQDALVKASRPQIIVTTQSNEKIDRKNPMLFITRNDSELGYCKNMLRLVI